MLQLAVTPRRSAGLAGEPRGNPRGEVAGDRQGEVVEWLMAPVLKTGDPQGSVGSNPTLSVH